MFVKNKKTPIGAEIETFLPIAGASTVSHRFRKDERGTIAIIFALTATIVFGLVGGAVDYGRWLSAKSQTMSAMDSAVLAAGRVLQISGKTEAEAILAAQQVYAQNKSRLLSVESVNFQVVGGNTVVATSTSSVQTPFMSVTGIQSLPVNIVSKAELAASSNAGSHVEISLMLDTTGSMAGQKMTALKAAAIDLVETVIWTDQSEFTSKIAIVPFAPYVNVGRDAFIQATNYTPNGNSDNRTCVKERDNSNRYTDATPSASNGWFKYYTSNSACNPQATVLPLTSNKQALRQRINEMQPSGTTAGHLGTQWAWYALSPNFSNLWPVASTPKPYSMLTQLNESGQPMLRKIAVLMTDGEYNAKYFGADSATQARAICANMKAAGLTVYTIGFQISSSGTAYETLRQCATSNEYFYNAANGAALQAAFRDIAFKIATLRLKE